MKVLFILITLWLMSAGTATANLSEARFRGHEPGYRYDIWVRYRPMSPFPQYPDAPKVWTRIRSLEVVINGQPVRVPQAATADLFWPHTPQPPYPGPDHTLRFVFAGGSGEKSYEAILVFSGNRLVSRELRPHLQKAIVTRYPER